MGKCATTAAEETGNLFAPLLHSTFLDDTAHYEQPDVALKAGSSRCKNTKQQACREEREKCLTKYERLLSLSILNRNRTIPITTKFNSNDRVGSCRKVLFYRRKETEVQKRGKAIVV
jgi:hypothetical protein